MARLVQFLLFIELIWIVPSLYGARHGFGPELLYADSDLPAMKVIETQSLEAFVRSRRDTNSPVESEKSTSSTKPPNAPIINVRDNVTMQTTKNITTMVSTNSIAFLWVNLRNAPMCNVLKLNQHFSKMNIN